MKEILFSKKGKEIDKKIDLVLSELFGMSYITQKEKIWDLIDWLFKEDKKK